MKTIYKLVPGVIAGLSIGVAAGYRASYSQQIKAPPVYVISEADAITDVAATKEYGAKVGATFAPFKGHYHFVVACGKSQSLDGDAPPTGIVIIAFDSAERARAWYESPAYQAIRPIRQASVKGRMFIVEGIAAQ